LGVIAAITKALEGQTVFWGTPTYDQCRVAWNELHKAAAQVAEFRIGRMEVLFPGGGRIILRSLDNPDNARGHTANGVIVDEVAFVNGKAWYDVLRPIISDTGGWALLMGTPQGRNWFWQEWHKALEEEDSESWQIPTLGVRITEDGLIRQPHPLENPDFSFKEAVRMWETLPQRVFEQEFLAEFVEDAGGVFRGVIRAAAATEKDGPDIGHAYVLGVDWAKYRDWTVIAVLDITTRELVKLDRFQRIDYTLQVERLKNIANIFKPKVIVAERNAMGEPLIELLRRERLPILPYTMTLESKKKAIEALSLAFERGDIRILPDRNLIAELQAYEAQRLPTGRLRYSAPAGFHDDTVVALALAWTQVVPVGTSRGIPIVGRKIRAITAGLLDKVF
jgi:phage FluMu gp28-like protein